MTNHEANLNAEVERAVAQFLVATRAAVMETMERAFAQASGAAPPVAKTRSKRRAVTSQRRTPAALEELSARLATAIAAHPGETMAVLCGVVGATPSALQVAVARLRREERIRTAGARQFTRYFPRA